MKVVVSLMKNKFIASAIFVLVIFLSVLLPTSIYADCEPLANPPTFETNYNGWGECSCETNTQICEQKQGCFTRDAQPDECMMIPEPETQSCTPDPNDCDNDEPIVPPGIGSQIIMRVKSIATGSCTTTGAQFQLLINDQSVFQGMAPSNGILAFMTYQHHSIVTADQVKVKYTGDCYDPNTTPVSNRDLFVDSITVNSNTYQSESPNTYSSGSWSAENQCGGGYKQSEILHCANGYFQYSTSLAPPPTAIPTNPPQPTTPPPTLVPSCPSQVNGDANCDSVITTEDFDIWKCQYLNSTSCNLQPSDDADFDRNGKVTINDFEIWRRNFNFADPMPPTNTPTPSPTSITSCFWCGQQCVPKTNFKLFCPDIMHPPNMSCILDKTTNTCRAVPSDVSIDIK